MGRQLLSFQELPRGARFAFHTARDGMLKIHRKANGDVVFTLSGRLDKEHVAELETLIGAEGKDCHIILDLKDMTLTGQDGITFLAQCEAAGISLVNCDPYVREWITRQRSGS
jgi:anti-anti-sigma regulatory factor